MGITQITQEAEFYIASYKNNKERKIKSRRKEESFFAFLVRLSFDLKRGGKYFHLFSVKYPP